MSKIIKIALGDDMRRKTYNDISFEAFKQDVASSFNLQNGQFIIKNQDKIINTEEEFSNIVNNNQSTIKFDIEKREGNEDVKVEIKVNEVPKPTIPENNNQNQNATNPRIPNIFSTLFGNMPPQFGQQPQQSNPLSMLMGFLPNMMGGGNNNGGIGGMFPALMQNLPNILKILTENLPKEKLQELLVTVLKSIPREQLISILKTSLSSPVVQESIINTLMSSFDQMTGNTNENLPKTQENNNNNTNNNTNNVHNEELKKQEETKRRIEELKRQQEEIKKKQEEELRRQNELKKQEENRKQDEQRRKEEEENKKKLEEFKKQQDKLQQQYEDQRKQEEQKRQEELKKQQEELLKKQEEERQRHELMLKEQEIRKKEIEEQERLKQEEIKRQEEEEMRKQQEELQRQQEDNKKNQFLQILQNNNIPYECYKNAEEIGLVESYGIEKITQLLIKYKGNVEMVANEVFN